MEQILDGAIQTRWKILPLDQRDGIKTYVVSKIIQVKKIERGSRFYWQALDLGYCKTGLRN